MTPATFVLPTLLPASALHTAHQLRRARRAVCVPKYSAPPCRALPRMAASEPRRSTSPSSSGDSARGEDTPVDASENSAQNAAKASADGDGGNSDNSVNNGGHKGSNNGSSDEGNGDDRHVTHKPTPVKPLESVPEPAAKTANMLQQATLSLIEWTKTASGKVGEVFKLLLNTVPAQVLVALISVLSTLAGTRMKEKRDKEKRRQQQEAQEVRNRAAAVAKVRENYLSMEKSLLKAAIKLALRLVDVVEGNTVDARGETRVKDEAGGLAQSAIYSTYLLARYLAAVELLKKHTETLDLGFPAADRIFSNIIGRVQGVLAADDDALILMQETERMFKPARGEKPVRGGPLFLLPRAQVTLGELMLRDYWANRKHSELVNKSPPGPPSINSILSYVEFCELLEKDSTMQRWCEPVKRSFNALEDARRDKPGRVRESRGSRVYFLQAALMDTVDFLDPGPRSRYVDLSMRRRLRLGDARYEEEPPLPKSLATLYNVLAALRDKDVGRQCRAMTSASRSAVVEVFVKAPEGVIMADGDTMEGSRWGDCPYSHGVLILLEEMGIPYRAVRIHSDCKPAWFHLVHPQTQTPVVYHEGHLVSESAAIVLYLVDRFTEHRKMPSSDHLRLCTGADRFARFHTHFLHWMCGDQRARAMLDDEMRALNGVLSTVRTLGKEGEVFFGGASFAREDTKIAPFLHHVAVAGQKLKGWSFPAECDAVREYLQKARLESSFIKTAADTDAIVAGYGRLVREGKDRNLAISVSLE